MAKRIGKKFGKRTRLASKKSKAMMPGMDEEMGEMPMKSMGMKAKAKKKRKRTRRYA